MPSWDPIFARGGFASEAPQAEVAKFVGVVEKRLRERPLKFWDHCCGAGRHTIMLAALGHSVFASDGSNVGIEILKRRLSERNLSVNIKQADMMECPWKEKFHAVVSWDAMHHNTLANIERTVATIREHLVDGGLLIATVKSTKADHFGLGERVEDNTYILPVGIEKGIMHHYFDEDGVKRLFSAWNILTIVEGTSRNVIIDETIADMHIFPSTKWYVVAER